MGTARSVTQRGARETSKSIKEHAHTGLDRFGPRYVVLTRAMFVIFFFFPFRVVHYPPPTVKALECVEVLGVVELVHRGGGDGGGGGGGDATFITTHHQHHRNIREEWKQGRKKPPTAADLRYQVKQGKGGLC